MDAQPRATTFSLRRLLALRPLRPCTFALLFFTSASNAASRAGDTSPRCQTRALIENLRSTTNHMQEPTKSLQGACAQVVEARRALLQAQPVKAAQLLQQAKSELPEIETHLELLSAEAWLLAGDSKKARSILLDLEEKHAALRAHPKTYALWSSIYRAENQPKNTIRKLREQLALRGADEVSLRHELALLLRQQKDIDAAHLELTELYVRFPAHPKTLALLTQLNTVPTDIDISKSKKRIDGLMMASRYIPAAQEAEVLLSSEKRSRLTVADVDVLEKFAVEARVRAGQTDLALQRVHAFPTPASDARQRLRAWTLGKAGLPQEATNAWKQLFMQSKDKAVRAEACFFSAFALYENDSLQEADRAFRSCDSTLRGSSWEVPGLWYQALGAILQGERTAALAYLEKLVTEHPRHREDDKHRYWFARILRTTPNATALERTRSDEILRALAEADSITYYGMLARQRLGLPAIKGTRVAPDALAKTVQPSSDAAKLRLLYELGFDDEVARQVKSLGSRRADLGLAHLVENAHQPWRSGGRFIPRPPTRDGHLRNAPGWRASYAMPYRELVRAHCAQNGISEAFAYAIMRTESGFDPRAQSPVGALGLLQLMPYTANGMALLLDRAPPTPQRLVHPETNIALGVAFLGLAEREFGHAAWAAAVYNGGPDNVARWMNKFGHLEPELFIERIPFRETRNYVKRVTATMALYRALMGEALRLELPSKNPGPAPTSFTWFPPSESSATPIEGAEAPGQ